MQPAHGILRTSKHNCSKKHSKHGRAVSWGLLHVCFDDNKEALTTEIPQATSTETMEKAQKDIKDYFGEADISGLEQGRRRTTPVYADPLDDQTSDKSQQETVSFADSRRRRNASQSFSENSESSCIDQSPMQSPLDPPQTANFSSSRRRTPVVEFLEDFDNKTEQAYSMKLKTSEDFETAQDDSRRPTATTLTNTSNSSMANLGDSPTSFRPLTPLSPEDFICRRGHARHDTIQKNCTNRRERRLDRRNAVKKERMLRQKCLRVPKHSYKLKQEVVGKLLLKTAKDSTLLNVLKEFDHFEEKINKKMQEKITSLGVGALWLYPYSQDHLYDQVSRPATMSLAADTNRQISILSSQPKRPSEILVCMNRDSTPDKASTPGVVQIPGSPPPAKTSYSSGKRTGRRPILDKKMSAMFGESDTAAKPKRKCISFDQTLFEQAREKLTRRFEILRWKNLGANQEQAVVVFNECITLEISLSLPVDEHCYSDKWMVTSIDHRVFSQDGSMHSLMGACISYVRDNYPSADLSRFLGVLYVIHHDCISFYRECKAKFAQKVSSVTVSKKGRLKLKTYGGIRVVLDLFSHELSLDFKDAPSLPSIADRPNLLKRRNFNFKNYKRANSLFNRKLIDLVATQIAFAQDLYYTAEQLSI